MDVRKQATLDAGKKKVGRPARLRAAVWALTGAASSLDRFMNICAEPRSLKSSGAKKQQRRPPNSRLRLEAVPLRLSLSALLRRQLPAL